MAVCSHCGREMEAGTSCQSFGRPKISRYVGVPHKPICGGCGTPHAGFHHPGCDRERCPECTGQLISCGCGTSEEEEEPGEDDQQDDPCGLCGTPTDPSQLEHLNLYVVGSEGVHACLACRIALTDVAVAIKRASARAHLHGVKKGRQSRSRV